MFILLNTNKLLNTYWIDNCAVDLREKTKINIRMINGSIENEYYKTEKEASERVIEINKKLLENPKDGTSGSVEKTGKASDTSFNNNGSGLVSNNVQDALIELNKKVIKNEKAETASQTPFDKKGSDLKSDNVQDVLIELNKKVIENGKAETALQTSFDNKDSNLVASNVQDALIELNKKLTESTKPETASQTSFNNKGSDLKASDVQNALIELNTKIGTLSTRFK